MCLICEKCSLIREGKAVILKEEYLIKPMEVETMSKTNRKNGVITWQALAFMCFSTLWGFGNVTNGFMFFNGTQVIFSWILMFMLYFVPYAFMVGELGSAFKNEGGGVTSWIYQTTGPKLAYYAGWTYWACHITYIASKGSGGLKALSWMAYRNAETYDSFDSLYVQLATLAVFLLCCFIASRGLNPLKKMATVAGTSMFVMSILYIIMMFAAPAINPHPAEEYIKVKWSLKAVMPTFTPEYFLSLNILVFAVGGAEKISPYVNKVENSAKNFPKGIIAAAIMVMICAIFGTVAMSRMFDPSIINESEATFNSYVSNSSYWAFQKLGAYYHVGDLFLILYALCNAIGQFAILILSIDAPLRMLLDDENTRRFVPRKLLKKNAYGAYSNGIKMVVVLSGTIILLQILVPGAAAVLTQLTRLNAVCMPMRYIWVFVAYIMLKKADEKFHADYMFTKKKSTGIFAGGWCCFVTAACCLMGVYNKDKFTMMLNIITPIVLTLLGIILPKLRAREDAKLSSKGAHTA